VGNFFGQLRIAASLKDELLNLRKETQAQTLEFAQAIKPSHYALPPHREGSMLLFGDISNISLSPLVLDGTVLVVWIIERMFIIRENDGWERQFDKAKRSAPVAPEHDLSSRSERPRLAGGGDDVDLSRVSLDRLETEIAELAGWASDPRALLAFSPGGTVCFMPTELADWR
jgi:hypothetical protein